MTWEFSLAGLLVGVVIGLTGIGGGSLMTPLLVLLFGVSPSLAIGTNLWFATVTKVVGSAKLHALGTVDWQVARRLWLGSLPTALIVVYWLNNGGNNKPNDEWLLVCLGWALLIAALSILSKGLIQRLGRTRRLETPETFKRAQPVLTVLAGVVLGGFVSLTSVGAGSLGAALLIYLYPLRMKPSTLVGTDVVHAVPLTFVAGLGHFWVGHTDLGMLGYLVIGSIPGILIGASLVKRVPEGLVRLFISLMLVSVGLKLVW